MATLSPNLSYSHYIELLPLKNNIEINYYIKMTEEQNLSVRELRNKIKSNEYERLDNKTKEKLKESKENKIEDFIKNPILIKNSYNYENISEKILKQLILEDIDSFLKELGEGFCYVVVELKITELKKEHIGQIETYMNYIDKNIKSAYQDKTIGIIIVKKDNMFLME